MYTVSICVLDVLGPSPCIHQVEEVCSEERVPLPRELLTPLMWKCISNTTTKLVRYVGMVTVWCIMMSLIPYTRYSVQIPHLAYIRTYRRTSVRNS